jgi:hypothetical protein
MTWILRGRLEPAAGLLSTPQAAIKPPSAVRKIARVIPHRTILRGDLMVSLYHERERL